jgi:hypothetical protein
MQKCSMVLHPKKVSDDHITRISRRGTMFIGILAAIIAVGVITAAIASIHVTRTDGYGYLPTRHLPTRY